MGYTVHGVTELAMTEQLTHTHSQVSQEHGPWSRMTAVVCKDLCQGMLTRLLSEVLYL